MTQTWTKMFGACVNEVHETSTTIKLSEKHSSIGLGFWAFDPL